MFFYISWGVNPPADIASGQDCRGAQEKYVMQLHDAHLAARMPRHSCLRRWLVIKEVEIISGL